MPPILPWSWTESCFTVTWITKIMAHLKCYKKHLHYVLLPSNRFFSSPVGLTSSPNFLPKTHLITWCISKMHHSLLTVPKKCWQHFALGVSLGRAAYLQPFYLQVEQLEILPTWSFWTSTAHDAFPKYFNTSRAFLAKPTFCLPRT